ncbi:beta-propeller fold lactonase family protein [Nostoc sp. CHAB 5784]|uniref:beta-propeller fold lactonase family protein n=1 Tax=Nostoc mirabile TaxID=2907820 RepID=UPI001E311040|nr:beta-propeller fold lactonase family protein [Nostoc mirabile]MCC5664227.1 beta-propeller fold lactonase family protein [Nostoc mirabile CHAB5784]
MKKRLKIFTLCLIVTIFVFLGFEFKKQHSNITLGNLENRILNSRGTEILNLELGSNPAQVLNSYEKNISDSVGAIVSITPISDNDYLIADFSKIYRLILKDAKIIEIKPVSFTEDNRQSNFSGKYVPTGLFFSKKYNQLFVANYTAKNILIFDVDIKNNQIVLKDEIKTSNTTGPENVFVSPDGKYLVCTNYDGNVVTGFNFSSGKWREIWSTKVNQAHGLAIVDKLVYATSLAERALFELDIHDGSVIRKVGSQGWNPENLEFLWPTSVYPFSENYLVVSDAHTGLISILDRQKLKLVKYFGGNGPTYKYFNMPYSAIVDNNKHNLIILSTFQKRIVFINLNSDETKNYVISNINWNSLYGSKDLTKNIKRLGEGWNSYVWQKGPVIKLFNKKYFLGYSALIPANGQTSPILKMPEPDSPFMISSSYFYFMDHLHLGKGELLFSPQAGHGLYLEERNGNYYLIPLMLNLDTWRVGDKMINPQGKIDTAQIKEQVIKVIAKFQKYKGKNGLVTLKDFCQLVLQNICAAPDQTLENIFARSRMKNVFHSQAAKLWYNKYSKCSKNYCQKEEINKNLEIYLSKVMKEPLVYLDEIFSIQMLSGNATTF